MHSETMISALLVIVPEAEAAVGPHRAVLDHAAAKGVPAHITALYPFRPAARLDAAVLAEVRDTVAGVPRFTAALTGVAWFDNRVVYLEPEPAAPLRALTAALSRRFPDCPPYGGAFADVVPHLTIGHDAPPGVLAAAAARVAAALPIMFAVDVLRLMAGTDAPGSWHTVAEFPLGRP